MCRSGYHIDCSGKCAKGWDPLVVPATEMLELPGNSSDLLLAEKEEDLEVAWNVAIACGWAAAATAVTVGAAVLRNSRGRISEEQGEYKTLAAGEKLLAA